MIETSKKIYNCMNFLSQISQFINVIFSNVTQPMLPSTFPMVFSSTAGFEKSIVRNSKCSKNKVNKMSSLHRLHLMRRMQENHKKSICSPQMQLPKKGVDLSQPIFG